jgi:cell shape-determining protein MreD
MYGFLMWALSAYLILILQSAFISEIFPVFLKPDLMLIMVNFLGVVSPLLPGSLLVFFCGFLMDTFSGSPFGLFLLVYLGIFFFIKLLAKFLIMGESTRFRISLVAFTLILQALGLAFLPWLLSITPYLSFLPLRYLLGQEVLTCAACWPLFQILKKVGEFSRETPTQPIT